jgi:hypothetical protein
MPTWNEMAEMINVNFTEIFNDIFRAGNIQRWVIATIQRRLEGTGKTADGTQLKTDKATAGNYYADYTIDIKDYLGQTFSHVTLKDSGDFYNSMRYVMIELGFEVEASFMKKNGHMQKNFTNQYGSQAEFEADVLSLSDNEIEFMMQNFINPKFERELNAALQYNR